VTDDTIYGHQPSKVDPNEYSSMISKNSNFKSVYKVTSIKQESDLMETIS
jgi:hypothetical protein